VHFSLEALGKQLPVTIANSPKHNSKQTPHAATSGKQPPQVTCTCCSAAPWLLQVQK
jgi:hypothetical protein